MRKFFLTVLGLAVSLPALADSFIPETTGSSTGSTRQQGNGMYTMLMLVVFIGVFYFLLIRPQMKRSKDLRQLVSNLKVGDEVATQGGLLGRVNKVETSVVELTVAEGVNVRFQKQAVSTVLPKGTVELKATEAVKTKKTKAKS